MDRERRVGKRLDARLRWVRETPGAETLSPEAWEAEARQCAEDGIDPPDRDEWIAAARDAGWEPMDPMHLDLIHYEHLRDRLGDVVVEGASGPVLEWPRAWGSWSLAEHRATIARHWGELDEIQREEGRR